MPSNVCAPDQVGRPSVIKPWLFEFFHQPLDAQLRSDPSAVQDHFPWYLALWAAADTREFEGIFFSEHHFGAAYSPSPTCCCRTSPHARRGCALARWVPSLRTRRRGELSKRWPCSITSPVVAWRSAWS